MNFKINLSKGSLKELIEILKEMDEHKIGVFNKSFTAIDSGFKNKFGVSVYKGRNKNHKAGEVPYTEITIDFENIEDKKEEEIEETEEEYTYSREELAELIKLPLTHPKLKFRKK